MTPPDRLESWKEIAAYLKRDVRTVQRWEAFESLPVHRHQHKKRGSVYALREELDAWRESRRAELFTPEAEQQAAIETATEPPPSRQRRWAWAAAAVLVAAALGATVMMREKDPAPVAAADRETDAPRVFGEAMRDGGSIDRIPLQGNATKLALSPDDSTLYVSLCYPGLTAVDAIDLRTRTTKWRVGPLKSCSPMALSADGGRLFAADAADVLVVDTTTGDTQRIQTTAATLVDLVVTPDGRTVYASAVFKGLLAITPSIGRVETLNPLPCPMYLALTPAGDRLYVNYQCSGPGGRRGHDAIDVIDTASNRSLGVITGLPNVGGELLVTPDGTQLWVDGKDACVADHYDHVGCPPGEGAIIHVIRTLDHVSVRALRVGAGFSARMGMSLGGSRIVVGSDLTSVVSTANLRETERIRLPTSSNTVFSKDGRTAYGVIGPTTSIAVLPMTIQPPPPAGITARWTMDGLAVDLVAENNFSGLDDRAFVPGRIGQAVRLNATSALRLSEPPNLGIDNGFATAMAWVSPDAGPAQGAAMTIFEYGASTASGPSGWRLLRLPDGRAAVCLGSDRLECDGPEATMVVSTSAIATDEWHHLAYTLNAGEITLFVDGRAEARGTSKVPTPNLANLWLRLGSDEEGRAPFLGRIDEAEIYSRPLTAGELAARAR